MKSDFGPGKAEVQGVSNLKPGEGVEPGLRTDPEGALRVTIASNSRNRQLVKVEQGEIREAHTWQRGTESATSPVHTKGSTPPGAQAGGRRGAQVGRSTWLGSTGRMAVGASRAPRGPSRTAGQWDGGSEGGEAGRNGGGEREERGARGA